MIRFLLSLFFVLAASTAWAGEWILSKGHTDIYVNKVSDEFVLLFRSKENRKWVYWYNTNSNVYVARSQSGEHPTLGKKDVPYYSVLPKRSWATHLPDNDDFSVPVRELPDFMEALLKVDEKEIVKVLKSVP